MENKCLPARPSLAASALSSLQTQLSVRHLVKGQVGLVDSVSDSQSEGRGFDPYPGQFVYP